MANQQTGNYQLSQWAGADRILLADFNSDNAKIDTAMKALADAVEAETTARRAADEAMGNCSITVSSYTGTGTSGSSNPTIINFTRKPIAFIIRGEETLIVATTLDTTTTFAISESSGYISFPTVYLSWDGTQAKLYCNSGNFPSRFQANMENKTYHVIAFYQET